MVDVSVPLLDSVVPHDATSTATGNYMSVQQLIRSDPTHVISYVKDKGLKKLGTFEVQDAQLLAALAGRNMLTTGADSAELDYETMWRNELAKISPEKEQDWGAKVTCAAYVVTVKHAAAADVDGLLYPLVLRYQAGNLNEKVFTLPAIAAVTNYKWDHFGFRLLCGELFCFLVWLLAYNAFILLFQDEDPSKTLPELLATPWGKVSVACEVLALVGMAPFLIIEGSTMLAYLSGWFSAWNLLDMVTYVNQVLITALHLGRTYAASELLTLLAGVQVILLWFRLQYFSRVFRSTKFAFLDGLTAVMQQTFWYFFFILLIMWGFGMGFFTLYRLDQTRTNEFDNVGATLMTMFKWMLGGADMDVVAKSSQPTATLVLAVVYQVVMCMVLMNLLVGVMMNAVTKVDENQDVLYYVSKATVTDELEATLPAFVEKWLGCSNPAFVHVLKIDKGANSNLELILGEDDKFVVEDPAEEVEAAEESETAEKESLPTIDVAAELAELKSLVKTLSAQVASLKDSPALKQTPSKKAGLFS